MNDSTVPAGLMCTRSGFLFHHDHRAFRKLLRKLPGNGTADGPRSNDGDVRMHSSVMLAEILQVSTDQRELDPVRRRARLWWPRSTVPRSPRRESPFRTG